MTTAIGPTTFNLTVKDGEPVISRELLCTNGDTISFTVTLPDDPNATLSDLHKRSAEQVIKLLQDWLNP